MPKGMSKGLLGRIGRVAGLIGGLFGLAVSLGACAETAAMQAARYTSFVDPAFRNPPVNARSVLVTAPTLGLSRRQAAEGAMAQQLRQSGLVAVLGLDVFPPTRGTPTDADVIDAVRDRGLSGAVVLWVTGEAIEVIRGTRTVTGTDFVTIMVDGQLRRVAVETRREVPTVSEQARATFRAVFLDKSGATVWTADGTFIRGDFDDAASDAGMGAIAKLQADGVVARPAAQAPGTPIGVPVGVPRGAGVPAGAAGGGLILPGLQ